MLGAHTHTRTHTATAMNWCTQFHQHRWSLLQITGRSQATEASQELSTCHKCERIQTPNAVALRGEKPHICF